MVNGGKKTFDIRLVEQYKGEKNLYRAKVCSPENIWATISFFVSHRFYFYLQRSDCLELLPV